MKAYVDASVLVPFIVAEAETERVIAFLANHRGRIVISEFAGGEVASAVGRLVRMGELTAALAGVRLSSFDAWRAAHAERTSIEDSDIAAAVALVRDYRLKLRMPDALHLALCVRHGYALATFDDRLTKAAQVSGVAVVLSALRT